MKPETPKAAVARVAERGGLPGPDVAETGVGASSMRARRPSSTAVIPMLRFSSPASAVVERNPSSGISTKPAATQPATAPSVLMA